MNPSIPSLINDNYVFTWQTNVEDGSGWGIYGQIFDKIGVEFKVNTMTTLGQQNPSISLFSTNFVVIWNSYGQDGNNKGIYGNLYQIDGLMIGFR